MIPILLLAAGQSARMRGTDKLLEPVDGMPLVRRQALMALRVSDDVRIALPPGLHRRHDAVADLPVTIIEVDDHAEGMGASLRTVFASLDADVTRAMLLLTDLPDLDEEDLRAVIVAMDTHPDALIWRGATQNGEGGHPMIFDQALFPALCHLSGDSGGRDIVRSAVDRVHHVSLPGDRARHDLDTPEDWAEWRAARSVISDDRR